MNNENVKTYLFSYWYLGAQYCLEIPAASQAEAMGRVAAITATAKYDGELMAKIPAEGGSWLPRLICWLMNRKELEILRTKARVLEQFDWEQRYPEALRHRQNEQRVCDYTGELDAEAAIERLIGEHREMRQKLALESKQEQHATDLDPADFF